MSKEFPVKVRLGAIDKLTAPLKKITNMFPAFDSALKKSAKAVHTLNKETERMQQEFNALGSKFKSAGTAMTVGITAPVVAGVALSIGAFREYQTALIGLGKTTNLEGVELDEMGKKFQDMSERIPVSANELLAYAQSAAQLGVPRAEIEKFTETMAKLSKASDIVGEEGAAQMAKLVNATRGSMSDVDRLASSIVYLGNNFAVTEKQVLEFGTRLGAATSIFNVSAQDALGIATALGSVGIQAELGSSGVQRSMLDIQESISKGGAKLQALSKITGIAANELDQAFKTNAVGVFQKFAAGLGKIGEKGGDVAKTMKFFGMEGVGAVQVMGVLSTKTKDFAKALDASRDAFKANQALNDEFKLFMESLDSKILMATNSLIKLAVAVGEKSKPAIEAGLEIFVSLVQFLQNNPVFTGVALAIAGVAAVIGPMLLLFGTFLTMYPSMLVGWGLITKATAGYALAAKGALATTGLIVGQLALVAAGSWAVYEALTYMFEKLGLMDTISKPGEWLADKLGKSDEELETEGAASVQEGINKRRANGRAGIEANTKINREFVQRTNNARVDVNVRAPQNTTVVGESENGMLSINRGMAGAF